MSPRKDGPFQVIEGINDNAYKIDLASNYNVSTTFNVADLSPYDAGDDSRSNPFEERGDDGNQELKFNQTQECTNASNPMTLCKFQLDQSQGQGPECWRWHWVGWFKTFWLSKQIWRLTLNLISFLIWYGLMKDSTKEFWARNNPTEARGPYAMCHQI